MYRAPTTTPCSCSRSSVLRPLQNLRDLTELNLSERGLEGELVPEVALMPNLTVLDLHENELSGAIPQEWAPLKLRLTTFDASDNPDLDLTWPEPAEPEPELQAAAEGEVDPAAAAEPPPAAVGGEGEAAAEPVATGASEAWGTATGSTKDGVASVATVVATQVSREETAEGHRVVSMVTSP